MALRNHIENDGDGDMGQNGREIEQTKHDDLVNILCLKEASFRTASFLHEEHNDCAYVDHNWESKEKDDCIGLLVPDRNVLILISQQFYLFLSLVLMVKLLNRLDLLFSLDNEAKSKSINGNL